MSNLRKNSRPGRSHLSAKAKQDESIMSTNNSCIASKRSVEKTYHGRDGGFLRYFVKKFQKRSPLIARGYWLRMKAIEQTVREFLHRGTTRKRVVVNLGCGYDCLPFNFLAHDPELCQRKNALFIDVDYAQLIVKKCDTIRSTPQLSAVIPDLCSHSSSDHVPISSSMYKAVACDLEDINKLENILNAQLDLDDCDFLFIAEVSMTYMDATAAERVIAWTSTLPRAQFCVLEQFLPDGHLHPFARTMLRHFEKLNSPLKSAVRYPSLQDQERRFSEVGWPEVGARSLWQLWADDKFLSPADRRALDEIEPFDEWEEFALFASHYFLLTASTSRASPRAVSSTKLPDRHLSGNTILTTHFVPYSKGRCCRRFGASFLSNSSTIIHHGGHGMQGRLNDYDLYQPVAGVDSKISKNLPHAVPDWSTQTSLMCHSISALDNERFLLVGGRTSPNSGLSRTSLANSSTGWHDANDLPYELYRHCAVVVRPLQTGCEARAVLVFGGKSDSSSLHDTWLYWTEGKGWQAVEVTGISPSARFGASMSLIGDHGKRGLLMGGIGSDGKVLDDVWMWEVVESTVPKVQCVNMTSQLRYSDHLCKEALSRFGASLVSTTKGAYLIGGVSGSEFLKQDFETLHISHDLEVTKVMLDQSVPRPLLIGCAFQPINAKRFAILGGGAVCFSFGTCWNEGFYTVGSPDGNVNALQWAVEEQIDTIIPERNYDAVTRLRASEDAHLPTESGNCGDNILTPVTGDTMSVAELRKLGGLEGVMKRGKATLLKRLDCGSCKSTWNTAYMKECIGKDRQVVVHSASSATMNFLTKDFSYKTMAFGEFLDLAEAGEHIYLRSLSASRPAEQVSNLTDDFPAIAGDFVLPPEADYVKDRIHSMPLRISGPVTMWLHYDVMANILCQIQGRKRLIVFPPGDVKQLNFPAGASSSRFDIFNSTGEVLLPPSTHAMVFDLEPGDVLYIPALWPHTAQPTSGLSIAVNVFFRSLESGYSAGKDVYGNRDVQAYENGRRDVQRMAKAFAKLPGEMGKFYLQRLAAELSDMAEKWEDGHGDKGQDALGI